MKTVQFETYKLNRVVNIHAIVSADYLNGVHLYKGTHAHEHAWELCYSMCGDTRITYNENVLTLDSEQCLLIAPGVNHTINLIQENAQAFVVSFTCMDAYLPMLRRQILDTTPRQQLQFQQILSELRAAFTLEENRLRIKHFNPSQTSPLGAEQLICCYLEEILIEMMRTVVRGKSDCGENTDLVTAVQSYLADQIMAYVRDHLGENLSVTQIATHFHYSRNQIGSLYKSATGTSLARAIALERIAKAKQMLEEHSKSITEISEELGYSSPQYFSKKFAQEVGCPPSQYVIQHGYHL